MQRETAEKHGKHTTGGVERRKTVVVDWGCEMVNLFRSLSGPGIEQCGLGNEHDKC